MSALSSVTRSAITYGYGIAEPAGMFSSHPELDMAPPYGDNYKKIFPGLISLNDGWHPGTRAPRISKRGGKALTRSTRCKGGNAFTDALSKISGPVLDSIKEAAEKQGASLGEYIRQNPTDAFNTAIELAPQAANAMQTIINYFRKPKDESNSIPSTPLPTREERFRKFRKLYKRDPQRALALYRAQVKRLAESLAELYGISPESIEEVESKNVKKNVTKQQNNYQQMVSGNMDF